MLKLTKFILKTTALIELTGAALLYPVFCRDFGAVKGIWYSIFHSVSAFCNAGFDLMGVREPFSSLTSYGGNTYVNVVLMLLIITGGTCAVNFCTTADGLFYSISTGTKFVDSEGNDIDNGIEPHYMLVKIDQEGEKDFSDVYNFDNLSKLFKEYYKLDDAPEPETTTDIASPTTETSTVSTENTTQTESYFAPVGQMGDYAKADYKSKTGKDATETVLKDNCDGTFSIILSDDKGNVLDTYTIDPATGKGKDSKGNNVDLPQTGINSMKKVAAAAVAVSFMTIGAGLVYVSGVGRKKKDNSKTT